METRTTFGRPILLWAGLFLVLVSPLSGQIVTASLTMNLSPPESPPPAINNLQVDLNASGISDSDTTQLSGTIQAIAKVNVFDPDNPTLIGLQFLSGNIFFTDMSFSLTFLPPFVDVSVTGTNIKGSIFTPSGKPELVSAGTFDATLHSFLMNQGILVAMGTAFGSTINETQDLSASPISGPGTATGFTAIVKTANTPLTYSYDIAMVIPVFLQESIPINPTVNVDATVDGAVQAIGAITVTILPNLKPMQKTVSGFDLEITGNPGANVILTATTDMVNFTDIANLTLPLPANTYTDTTATSLDGRYYLLRKP